MRWRPSADNGVKIASLCLKRCWTESLATSDTCRRDSSLSHFSLKHADQGGKEAAASRVSCRQVAARFSRFAPCSHMPSRHSAGNGSSSHHGRREGGMMDVLSLKHRSRRTCMCTEMQLRRSLASRHPRSPSVGSSLSTGALRAATRLCSRVGSGRPQLRQHRTGPAGSSEQLQVGRVEQPRPLLALELHLRRPPGSGFRGRGLGARRLGGWGLGRQSRR